ncbi:eEF1A lysine and N-terminal methyltransferase isoform X1 [Palaemon carinicauda]|uniref:eEF1A lysine and N-terminal methyltransferase isoform X1 n=2 Tax=Palaemon carinicauda TaxID=392227 RepID=UPI0035B680CC
MRTRPIEDSVRSVDKVKMNLLPKTHKEFSSKEYWNTFFSQRGTKAFEWYGEYTELCGLLHKYIKLQDKILIAGCGNSAISADLHKVGYKDIINVDISEIVIRQMQAKYSEFPDMQWLQMDITASTFEDEQFSCVFDKGTLDALMTDSSQEVISTINKYFTELSRVLRVGGRYVCVSLLQEHIMDYVLQWFPQNCWMVRVCRCEEAEKARTDVGEFSFPVFVLVCTKFRQMPNFNPVIEIQLHGDMVQRVKNPDELKDNVRELQQYALLRHNLHTQKVAGENMCLDLFDPKSGNTRYLLHVVDSPKNSHTLKFAVFIVPHGREHEWMFGTVEGRSKLAENAGALRLVVVHLCRDQVYESLKAIQDELSGKVLEIAPSKLPPNTKIPFLSVGDDLGSRKEVKRGHSKWSGDYLVEEVHLPESLKLRRLIFLSNQNVIQSEAKLTTVREKKKKGKVKESIAIDHSYLSCEHHLAMVAGLGLIKFPADLLLIGLGGGLLATYIHKYFSESVLTAVDLDPAMVDVAQEWFGFTCNSRLKAEVADGLDFITKAANEGNKYSVIMFDVDSKDSSLGMSCPPRSFVERNFLNKVATCLTEGGILILNLVCRDENLKAEVLGDVKAVFTSVLCQQIPEEVNCILLCSNSLPEMKNKWEKGLQVVNSSLKEQQKSKANIINMMEYKANVKVLSP